jgi:SAM-dependent methyltransferase
VSKRAACGSCGSNILQPFLDLGETPLADAFPKSPDEPEAFYPLGLCVCHKCWLVQNTEVVPDELLYNDDYGFYTGASPSSIAYFADYAADAVKRFNPKFVVEIASNDGTLLRQFTGARKLGVEPSANVAKVAQVAAIPTIVEPFGRKVAADIVSLDGWPDLVIANNVIAHVSDLDDFVGGLADLLGPKGTAIIEFQYVADLLAFNQFDHVYHEHRSFFSLSSLDRVLARHGLRIFDYEFTPAQGGSIRAYVQRREGVTAFSFEDWLASPGAYAGFQGRVDRLRDCLVELVWERQQIGPVAGYGASAKSTTLLNYCGLGALDYVEDLTPAKIGRYTPGTHIPIRKPADEYPVTFLLLVWNYLSGVLDREADFRQGGGRFIVPIPMPVLL